MLIHNMLYVALPVCKLFGKQDITQLALSVRLPRCVLPVLEMQIFHLHASHVVSAGWHSYDSDWCTLHANSMPNSWIHPNMMSIPCQSHANFRPNLTTSHQWLNVPASHQRLNKTQLKQTDSCPAVSYIKANSSVLGWGSYFKAMSYVSYQTARLNTIPKEQQYTDAM